MSASDVRGRCSCRSRPPLHCLSFAALLIIELEGTRNLTDLADHFVALRMLRPEVLVRLLLHVVLSKFWTYSLCFGVYAQKLLQIDQVLLGEYNPLGFAA